MTDPAILVAGETLVDFLPDEPGPLAAVETFDRRAGGAPANVAVGLARLDTRPWFWTRVGADPFGEFLVRRLSRHGVPGRFVERDPDAKTSLAFVSHDADADRAFTFYRDGTADTRLEPGRVPDAVLEAVSCVVVGGVTLASEPARTATLDLVARARRADATVVFDPNARPELWGEYDFADTVREVLDQVDIVKATPEDLTAADLGTPEDEPAALSRTVCEQGPHTVLLTLGGAGAHARATASAPWGPATVTHEGFDVDPVDTTGAGDAFTAGALAAFVDGTIDLEAVLERANAVAALTTTAPGAMTSLPTPTELDAFLDRS